MWSPSRKLLPGPRRSRGKGGTGQPSLLSLNWVHGSMDLPVPSSSTWNSGESEVEGGGRESKKEGAVLGTYLHSAVHLGLG